MIFPLPHPFRINHLSSAEKSDWDLEYVLRKNLGIKRDELEQMSIGKVKYFLELIKKEQEELEASMKNR